MLVVDCFLKKHRSPTNISLVSGVKTANIMPIFKYKTKKPPGTGSFFVNISLVIKGSNFFFTTHLIHPMHFGLFFIRHTVEDVANEQVTAQAEQFYSNKMQWV